jgi:hypothetical protein
MDQSKSLEMAYEAVDDELQAWKDAEREMARFSKELEDRQAEQLVREQMSLRAALRAPTLAANVGKGMNNAATMGATLKGIDDRRKAQDEYQARLAYLYAAREKRLNNLKGRFANLFHYMEPDDLARPSCIANLGDDLFAVHIGKSRSTPGKKFSCRIDGRRLHVHASLRGGLF